MKVVAVDIGGTKIAFALLNRRGDILESSRKLIEGLRGDEVTALIVSEIKKIITSDTAAIGISVPGIVWHAEERVWAPNIQGWENYPLHKEMALSFPCQRIVIESDRTCYIMGETWKGTAYRTRNAIFLAIGTGIGAGIMTNNNIVHGIRDIGGAVGWMALPSPLISKQKVVTLEQYASGTGIPRLANEIMEEDKDYQGVLRHKQILTATDVLAVYDEDEVAKKTIDACIVLWGLCIANLVSIFNPEKVILGGGVFGPAVRLIPQIKMVADEYCQPLSGKIYEIVAAATGKDAGLFGAGRAAVLSENY